MLYHHPAEGVQDWRLPVNLDLLRTIRGYFPKWDIDAYLPPQTMKWCQDFFDEIGFQHTASQLAEEARTSPFSDIYLQLRTALQEHIRNGNDPQLSLLPSPRADTMPQNQPDANVRHIDLETDPISEWENAADANENFFSLE